MNSIQASTQSCFPAARLERVDRMIEAAVVWLTRLQFDQSSSRCTEYWLLLCLEVEIFPWVYVNPVVTIGLLWKLERLVVR